ncbi:hypothetical protein HBI56_225330 [Parastagonospora nodorum]|uniref:F-box domain-containing protein n=2 Tax=Phaeosphaeria nodorum (strain SN15 / ATCC MYA-4574 / FGSC 10173) TaxID=321614 RepID=A0A7U2IDI8_PHANO|nr:hypothetical protein SNOG_16306 [Parastagonospora nodorum SN15]KAH3904087.1 hypothetical protein HBH56_238950 [Parastagonospora nodorum]EAT76292.1 hypothetical protein SNOG_16306 [Parastagonospora nodorum SN15]KAH3921591.1 hypothetical protein HBH54_237090 [Parastagonospora nodorum]KAH3957920.1 hypothetical protein HBH51_217560 [Parastagonospora nodorum]KAH3967366.1 hypothetical protein HBH52_186790 [Parastagonospora nodorum]
MAGKRTGPPRAAVDVEAVPRRSARLARSPALQTPAFASRVSKWGRNRSTSIQSQRLRFPSRDEPTQHRATEEKPPAPSALVTLPNELLYMCLEHVWPEETIDVSAHVFPSKYDPDLPSTWDHGLLTSCKSLRHRTQHWLRKNRTVVCATGYYSCPDGDLRKIFKGDMISCFTHVRMTINCREVYSLFPRVVSTIACFNAMHDTTFLDVFIIFSKSKNPEDTYPHCYFHAGRELPLDFAQIASLHRIHIRDTESPKLLPGTESATRATFGSFLVSIRRRKWFEDVYNVLHTLCMEDVRSGSHTDIRMVRRRLRDLERSGDGSSQVA